MLNDKDLELISTAFTIYDKLSEEEKELLLSYAENIEYKKGERVYGGGNDCVGVLLIKKVN